MNIEKIIAALAGMSQEQRESVRSNAAKLFDSGNADQKAAADRIVRSIDEIEASERDALIDRLRGMNASARVVEAFRRLPMTETEIRITQALLDNPNATSAELSQKLGWGAQTWHMHFGVMCARRATYLWPAPKSEVRDADFYSGILADISGESRWTIKPEVAAALAEIGLEPRERAASRSKQR